MKDQQYAATREQVNRWREYSRYNNQWRRDSVKANEYFDGNQFDYELKLKYLERGLPLLYENCIRRWITTVLGQQRDNQADGVVRVEDNRFEQLGEALSVKLKEAERLSHADMAIYQAFDAMIKGGIGWVEVGDPIDPFSYEHRVENIPWREMWWDTSDKTPGLSNAEWFRRVQYHRRNDVLAAFPDSTELVKLAGSDDDPLTWAEQERYERSELYQRDPSQWSRFSTDSRDMMCLNEIRYRVWFNGYIMEGPAGPEPFYEDNEEHLKRYYAGLVNPMPARYRRSRRAYWLGPHLLHDSWLDLPNGEIGWVPFLCYVEDLTGVPYGLIRDMIPLQDEINTRKAKAAWAIDQTTIVADHDAAMDWDDVRNNVNRRNGIILLDGSKPNKQFSLDRHQGLSDSNLRMYESAKATIGYIHGLDAPFAGSPSTPGQSGVAIKELQNQSQASLGLPIDNYRDARLRVLNLLLDRIVQRFGNKPMMLKYQRQNDNAVKQVAVNIPVEIDGQIVVLSPKNIRKQLVIDDVPSTPTYRRQQYERIVNTLNTMPPEAQMMMLPVLFEMSDIPNRMVYADMARKQLGIGEPRNQEEADAQAAEQEKKDMADRIAIEQEAAKLATEQAKAAKLAAEREAIEQDIKHQEMVLAAGPTKPAAPVLRW